METKNTIDCIEACYDCAVACEDCATACLREPNVERLIRCIELDRQCAAGRVDVPAVRGDVRPLCSGMFQTRSGNGSLPEMC